MVFFVSLAFTIDCYECRSQNGDHPECEDTFVEDITTYGLIARNCYFGIWKGQYCIKLKGTRGNKIRAFVWSNKSMPFSPLFIQNIVKFLDVENLIHGNFYGSVIDWLNIFDENDPWLLCLNVLVAISLTVYILPEL